MPTRRKTLAGGAGLLALLAGVVFVGDENGSDRGPDDRGNVEPESEPETEPEPESEPETEPEPESESDPESEPDGRNARFATTVAFSDEEQRVSESVEFDVTVENVGNTSGEYTVELELDRIDPDTDFGSNTWHLFGELGPDEVETHVAEHYYRATGTYELRLDDEVIKEFDVPSSGSSRSTSTDTDSQSSDGSDDEEHLDGAPTVEVGGQAAVNATEESASQYDLD